MKVYFDSIVPANEIDSDYIGQLSLNAPLFDGRFYLGATACQEVDLMVETGHFPGIPDVVYITDDTDVKQYTLLVDSVEIEDDFYTHFTLTDAMVRFNQSFDWSNLASQQAQDILDAICSLVTEYTCNAPTVSFGGTYEVTWDYGISARDFISSLAEINGCIARIDANGDLEFSPITNTVDYTIDPDTVSGYTVGDEHTYDCVVYDNGIVVVQSTTMGTSPYMMNTDNVIFTEGREQEIVDHIYTLVNGLSFYNIEIEQCEINDAVRSGDILSLTVGNDTYRFIAELNQEYNVGWSGGYTLDVENDVEQQTEVITTDKKLVSIRSTIDRQQGILEVVAQQTETMSVHFVVDANDQDVKVSNQDEYPFSSYTSFKGDGMRIYVEGENDPVASATSTMFECHKGLGVQDWAIVQGTNNGELVLNFFRKPVS